jgi:hypothetical protein
MKSLTILVMAAFAVMLFALPAHALYTGTVDVEIDGFGANAGVGMWVSCDDDYDPANPQTYEKKYLCVTSGIYSYIKLGSTGEGNFLPDRFGGFCVELDAPRENGTYNLIMPEDGPDPGVCAGGAMGTDKAELLRKLWGMAFDKAWYAPEATQSQANKDAAEAFGVAVWEIVHERSGLYDVTDGSCMVSPYIWDCQVNLGTDYVNQLIADAEQYGGPLPTLRIMSMCPTEENGQDILVEIPEPGSVSMIAFGLVGLLAFFRRRQG